MLKILILTIVTLISLNLAHAHEVPIGGKFELVNTEKEKITEQDLLGKYNLVYFGYTTCPKVCPMAVSNMSNVYDYLTPEEIQKVKIYFITIDPRLDNINKVKEFMSNFDPRIIGLTGTKEQIKKAQDSYRVYSQVTPQKDENGNIIIDHSSFIYLMDPSGKYFAHFAHDASGKEMAKKLKVLMK